MSIPRRVHFAELSVFVVVGGGSNVTFFGAVHPLLPRESKSAGSNTFEYLKEYNTWSRSSGGVKFANAYIVPLRIDLFVCHVSTC